MITEPQHLRPGVVIRRVPAVLMLEVEPVLLRWDWQATVEQARGKRRNITAEVVQEFREAQWKRA